MKQAEVWCPLCLRTWTIRPSVTGLRQVVGCPTCIKKMVNGESEGLARQEVAHA
jgi:hypothetical protein